MSHQFATEPDRGAGCCQGYNMMWWLHGLEVMWWCLISLFSATLVEPGSPPSARSPPERQLRRGWFQLCENQCNTVGWHMFRAIFEPCPRRDNSLSFVHHGICWNLSFDHKPWIRSFPKLSKCKTNQDESTCASVHELHAVKAKVDFDSSQSPCCCWEKHLSSHPASLSIRPCWPQSSPSMQRLKKSASTKRRLRTLRKPRRRGHRRITPFAVSIWSLFCHWLWPYQRGSGLHVRDPGPTPVAERLPRPPTVCKFLGAVRHYLHPDGILHMGGSWLSPHGRRRLGHWQWHAASALVMAICQTCASLRPLL